MSRNIVNVRRLRASAAVALCLGLAGPACAAPEPVAPAAHIAPLEQALAARAAKTDGSLGACILDGPAAACVNGDRAYPMQSVFKFVAAIAALDAVDAGRLTLDTRVLIRPQDRSVFVQPLAAKVGPDGYRASIREMIIAAVVQSDSLAADILLEQVGGPAGVKAMLARKQLAGVRVDRDERRLASEINGLAWRQDFAEPSVFEAAIDGVPEADRDRAFAAYRSDPRDRATPRGMAELLRRLAAGELLSADSTLFLLQTLALTETFPDRLPAGAPADWWVGHKTGTSGSWKGVNAVTADVGLLRRPDGRYVAVAAFLADSRGEPAARNAVIADVARIAATGARPFGETDPEWRRPTEPFRAVGNIHYVGTYGLSAWLVTTPQGHVLIDAAGLEAGPVILANIRKLGFNPRDVRLLLNTHAHVDHAGGMADLKAATGARLLASAADKTALEAGQVDYGFTRGWPFPAVQVDQVVADGQVVRLGGMSFTAHLTPGHTKGTTAWTTSVQEGGRTLSVLFNGGATVAGQKLRGDPNYPNAAAEFAATFDKLGKLRADVFLSNHPSQFDLHAKRRRQLAGEPLAFVDPGEAPRRVAAWRAAFEKDLAAGK